MLKYSKKKPVIAALTIAALAAVTAGILLITRPSSHSPSVSQESALTESTAQVSAEEQTAEETTATGGSEETSVTQTADAVSSASTVKPAATEKPAVTVKTTVQTQPTAKATEKPQTTAAATASPSTGAYADFQERVIALVNEERTSRKLQALTGNTKLSDVATMKSRDMADLGYFDHTSPTYGSPFDMMKQFGIGFQTAGENIAMGQTTPEQVMDGWMNSDGHRANILNANFTQIGVGVAKDASGRLYWTQMFIG